MEVVYFEDMPNETLGLMGDSVSLEQKGNIFARPPGNPYEPWTLTPAVVVQHLKYLSHQRYLVCMQLDEMQKKNNSEEKEARLAKWHLMNRRNELRYLQHHLLSYLEDADTIDMCMPSSWEQKKLKIKKKTW